jgi:hypothetical protein
MRPGGMAARATASLALAALVLAQAVPGGGRLAHAEEPSQAPPSSPDHCCPPPPPPPPPGPVVVAPPPPRPLSDAAKVVYAPFYLAGLTLRYGLYYLFIAPFEVFGRALSYGANGGVEPPPRYHDAPPPPPPPADSDPDWPRGAQPEN